MRKSDLAASSATPEEDSYGYRVEWDDQTTSVREMIRNGGTIEHYGLVQEMFQVLIMRGTCLVITEIIQISQAYD